MATLHEKHPAGRDLDALVAERVMGWERKTLYDHILNPEFFVTGKGEMYLPAGQTDYLCRPGRLANTAGPVCAREQIGDLTIGGDKDLPRYSADPAAAVEVRAAVREWILSKRRRFANVLLRIVTARVAPDLAARGERIAFEHVYLLVTPHDDCLAALLARGAIREADNDCDGNAAPGGQAGQGSTAGGAHNDCDGEGARP